MLKVPILIQYSRKNSMKGNNNIHMKTQRITSRLSCEERALSSPQCDELSRRRPARFAGSVYL